MRLSSLVDNSLDGTGPAALPGSVAQFGLTAFLALLDSGTGVRQNSVPAPGYPTYPGTGPRGAWAPGAVVVAPPVVIDGAIVCSDPS